MTYTELIPDQKRFFFVNLSGQMWRRRKRHCHRCHSNIKQKPTTHGSEVHDKNINFRLFLRSKMWKLVSFFVIMNHINSIPVAFFFLSFFIYYWKRIIIGDIEIKTHQEYDFHCLMWFSSYCLSAIFFPHSVTFKCRIKRNTFCLNPAPCLRCHSINT